MKLISGQSNPILAERIAKETGAEIIETKIENFNDGELRVQVMAPVGNDVIIVQSTCTPVNDHLMELLLLADTAKRAGARNITAIVPYFGYSRQDRCTYKFGPLSAALVIKMIETAGITRLLTLDLHSSQLEGSFNIPIINLDPANIFFNEIENTDDTIVVSPDIGGIPRARNFSSLLGKDLAIINKSRSANNESVMSEVIGSVKNKKCVLIDDIADSGGTLCQASELLMKNGAKEVVCFISHAVLSGTATYKINQSSIKHVYISDSIIHERLPDKFKTIQIHKLFATAL
jgi:ribose-phosphate pyrophosphokinase